jgi:hypothetical protein
VGGFLNTIKGWLFSTVNDEAISVAISTDTQPRLRIDAGGRVKWGPGGATAPDTYIERGSAGVVAFNGGITLGTDLAVTEGGTGASSASAARSNLGVFLGETHTFGIPGSLIVTSGVSRIYFTRAATISNVVATVGTAPTGAAIIFDVNKNGTTIFTTQGSRPTIAISGFVDLSSVPDVTTIEAGDYLTIDVDQVGSTIAGANAVVQIEFQYTA